MEIIVFDQVTKTYPAGFQKRKTALERLTLAIAQGTVFGFLGPNGAGKSTAIKILLNLIFPTSGQAFILGAPAADKTIRRRVGYLPENPNLYDHLTPEELLWFGGKTADMVAPRIKERTDTLLGLVDLAHVRRQRLRSFSKGMFQRAAVALALISDPEVVIFDEPMSGLDPLGRKLIGDIIRQLKQEGKTVFFSSHILHDAEDLCDQVGIIVKGRLRQVIGLTDRLSAPSTGWRILLKGTPEAFRDRLNGLGSTCVARGSRTEVHIPDTDFGKLLDRLGVSHGELVSAAPLRPTLEEVLLQEVERADGEAE